MAKIRKYDSFILGIFVASFTWFVSLYLYFTLVNSGPSYTTPSTSLMKFKQDDKFSQFSNHDNEILLPYEKNQKMNHKSKYLSNSDKLIKSLKAKSTVINKNLTGLEELGLVRTIQDQNFREYGYKKYAFNILVSNRMSLHRKIPDTRHNLCKTINYPNLVLKASIVICFYNEHLNTLLRTVHSILDRTQDKLLYEIILVDDFSDLEDLHSDLETALLHVSSKIHILKTLRREGLIRARMFGAENAQGDVLVFLDSHVEVNVGWLEPLLSRIQEDHTRVTVPVIDIINSDTFEYSSSPLVRGGFNWGLHFKWENVPKNFLNTDEDFVKPIRSPTMAGGLFAMERKYFHELGEYDSGMDIWGGENLEISFRIWMCGGSLEVIPCSRVGHVFRKRRPYSAPNGVDTMTRNSARVAHVWLDEYKDHFFKIRQEAKTINFGDITQRQQLRKKLNCKSFRWYLEEIYPEHDLPGSENEKNRLKKKWSSAGIEQKKYQPWHLRERNYLASYQLRLTGTNLCAASAKDVKTKGAPLALSPCLRVKNQIWYETDKRELVLAQLLCLDSGDKAPRISKCHEMKGDQEWSHNGQKSSSPIYNVASGTCLAAPTSPQIGTRIVMALCNNEKILTSWDIISADIGS